MMGPRCRARYARTLNDHQVGPRVVRNSVLLHIAKENHEIYAWVAHIGCCGGPKADVEDWYG